MERNNRKKKWNVWLPLLVVLGVILLFVGVYLRSQPKEPEIDDTESQSSIESIFYEGKEYVYNRDLTNILFLGIDQMDEIEGNALPGDAGQSDCILLFTLNRNTEEARILQIPRDTMTTIDLYDVGGNSYGTVTEQIATQYAYGIGGKQSCFAATKTVSELLYELPIDGYLSMNISSIPAVTDAIGGVTLTLHDDYTYLDETYVKGATVTLNGEQAHRFVRYRDTKEAFSNNGRMQRQREFIPAFISAVRNKAGNSENYYEKFYPLVGKYMLTDLSAEQINRLAKFNLNESETTVLQGEGKMGEKYEEFYPDEKKLRNFLLKTFYICKE